MDTDRKVDQVLLKLESIDRWRAEAQAKQEKHEKTLYGNGQPGHDEMIREIFAFINAQKETALRRRVWWDKLQWVVIPMVIGGAATLLYQAFIFFTQIAPILESLK